MTREVWPKQKTKEALEKVVCLAVHRYGAKDSARPRSYPPSPWAIRFNVMAYPQFRFIDADCRQLPMSNEVARSPEGIVAAVERALAAHATKSRSAPYSTERGRELAQKIVETAVDVDRLWPLTKKTGFSEVDPVGQLVWLDRMEPDPEKPKAWRVLGQALDGPNDYVRIEALGRLGRLGGARAATLAGEQIRLVLAGRSRYANPNNVLIAALGAAKSLPEPALAPALSRVLAERNGNNTATLLAAEALLAIGEKCGFEVVEQALAPAAKLEGVYAERIRELIDAARRR